MTTHLHAFFQGFGQTSPQPEVEEQSLRNFLQTGQEAFPNITLAEAVALCELGARARQHADDDVMQWLEVIESADMYLAIACATESEGAFQALERAHGSELRGLLRRYAREDLTIDDLYQLLFERIFVTTPKRSARILDYSGKGQLRNWLRVSAVRMSIDQLRSTSKFRNEVLTIEEDQLLHAPDEKVDLELDFLKRKYRADFKVAFERGLASLESADRNLLRQHLIGRLSIDQIGTLHNIHRATAARRLARCRQLLLQHTRNELMALLSIDHQEFESIMNLISSNLEVSFVRLLGKDEASKHA